MYFLHFNYKPMEAIPFPCSDAETYSIHSQVVDDFEQLGKIGKPPAKFFQNLKSCGAEKFDSQINDVKQPQPAKTPDEQPAKTPAELFESHQKLVSSLVNKLTKYFGIKEEAKDDLMQAGFLGLWEAANGYEPRGNKFISYAFWRVRGAIIDEMRKLSCFSRAYRKRPTMISLDQPLSSGDSTPLLDSIPDDNQPNIDDSILQREVLEKALKILFGKRRQIFELYYLEGLSYPEIGKQINLSKSRISRIMDDCKEKIARALCN